LQALEFLDGAESVRRAQFAGDAMFSALIVRGRTPGEIEIEPRLLAVGDDIEAGGELIVQRGDDGIVLHLREIVGAEALELRARGLEPGGKGIAADDGGAEGAGLHGKG
jgi:hypothetical protein